MRHNVASVRLSERAAIAAAVVAASCCVAVVEAWQPPTNSRSSEAAAASDGRLSTLGGGVREVTISAAGQATPREAVAATLLEAQGTDDLIAKAPLLLRRQQRNTGQSDKAALALDAGQSPASGAIQRADVGDQEVDTGNNATGPGMTPVGADEDMVAASDVGARYSHHPRSLRFISTTLQDLFGKWWPARLDADWDGILEVANPVSGETSLAVAQEENRACWAEKSLVECMSSLGSYGIQRLYTYPYYLIKDRAWEQPDWMAHEAVRQKRLSDMTFPMSHASTAFELDGAHGDEAGKGDSVSMITQTYDIFQQLMLGVRAFDIEVAYNTRTKHIYCAHKLLTISLARALADVKRFLEEYVTEVVVLDLRKAKLVTWEEFGTLAPLDKELQDPFKLPGQIVHNVVLDVLGEFLADYHKLAGASLSGGADLENPTIGELTRAKARVIYFWEGQQVLCATMRSCMQTPGWKRAALVGGSTKEVETPSANFAFGPPLALGTREASDLLANATFRLGNSTWNATDRVLEPLCMNPSNVFTQSEEPTQLLNKLRTFTTRIREVSSQQVPFCYPAQTELPELHAPPLLHRVDAWVELRPEVQEALAEILMIESKHFVQGEALTVRSVAERVAYLLLLWYFQRDNAPIYTKANLIAMDHVHPVLISRIISAMKENAECGFSVFCKDSGSCFAADLHTADDRCVDQFNTERFLTNFAEGAILSWETRYLLFAVLFVTTNSMGYHAMTKMPSHKSKAYGRALMQLGSSRALNEHSQPASRAQSQAASEEEG
eukprot:TRINITY_DN93378_c0_g1_i1.p1 TRINITY_DN93378_c0_g1~~TRINITY_DN93378_c0_g1_i1.p1  ORF type:complete len:782 (+),score=180.36 TRINITY_DN93378_c0_g1_i1:107-2452(+)